MKKAKLMLAAIAVMTVVSGITAFKAKEKLGAVIYQAPEPCTKATITRTNLTLTSNPTFLENGYFTTIKNAVVCDLRAAYSLQ